MGRNCYRVSWTTTSFQKITQYKVLSHLYSALILCSSNVLLCSDSVEAGWELQRAAQTELDLPRFQVRHSPQLLADCRV